MTSCVWKTSSKPDLLSNILFLKANSDEEDEEDEGANGKDDPESSAKRVKEESDADPTVKTEEGEDREPVKKARQPQKTSSNELHIYSAAELSRLNQRELLADVQLLDGVLVFRTQACLLTSIC
jgi:hypothetical protein